MKLSGWLAMAVVLTGCAATPGYDGPRRGRAEVAVVSASLPVTAGAPVTVRLRKADGNVLAFGIWRIELEPGPHTLLVDCTTRDPDRTTRHELAFDAEPGARHRLVPVVGSPQEGCTAVTLE